VVFLGPNDGHRDATSHYVKNDFFLLLSTLLLLNYHIIRRRIVSKVSKLQHIRNADSLSGGIPFDRVEIKRLICRVYVNFQRKPATRWSYKIWNWTAPEKGKCGKQKKLGS
jgi:hypothetical protein